MKLQLFDYLTFMIFVAGLIAVVRWKTVDRRFHSFFILIWVGCVNDALSYLLVAKGYHTILNNNIYLLLEALMLLWFFKNIGLFKRRLKLLFMTILILSCAWLLETAMKGIMNTYCVRFSVIYSLAIVLMSIATINNLLISHQGPVLKDSLFLISIGFIIFFTLNILVKAFWLYGVGQSNGFLMNIYNIMLIANFVTNIIYAAAIVLMPRRHLLHAPATSSGFYDQRDQGRVNM